MTVRSRSSRMCVGCFARNYGIFTIFCVSTNEIFSGEYAQLLIRPYDNGKWAVVLLR